MEWLKEQFRKEYVIYLLISAFIIIGMLLVGINESLSTVTYEHANKTVTEISKIQPQNLNEFNKKIEPLIMEIFKNKVENQKLSALRDLLLPKLMSGEIRV